MPLKRIFIQIQTATFYGLLHYTNYLTFTRTKHFPPPSYHEISTCYILNFNYTTIFDRLISCLYPHPSYTGPIPIHAHVHGTCFSDMIIGVDNLCQVANPGLFTSPRQRRPLVKPLLNQQSDRRPDEFANYSIQCSSEICIFGMSLGETDGVWWRLIGKWMTGSSHRHLVIFSQTRQPGPPFLEDRLDRKDALLDRFLSLSEIPPGHRRSCRSRIHVVITSNFFDLKPVFLSGRYPFPFQLSPPPKTD